MKIEIENFVKQVEDCYCFLGTGEILKKPYISKLGDDSTLIEWIFPKFRVGFSFENPKVDSFFYIVANKELRGFNHSETFKTEFELEMSIKTAVDYIAENKDR